MWLQHEHVALSAIYSLLMFHEKTAENKHRALIIYWDTALDNCPLKMLLGIFSSQDPLDVWTKMITLSKVWQYQGMYDLVGYISNVYDFVVLKCLDDETFPPVKTKHLICKRHKLEYSEHACGWLAFQTRYCIVYYYGKYKLTITYGAFLWLFLWLFFGDVLTTRPPQHFINWGVFKLISTL